MHFHAPAVLCVALLTLTAAPDGTASTPDTSTAPPISGSEAAARHAKRTACLKQAKAKKLIGDARNTYIKECVSAP